MKVKKAFRIYTDEPVGFAIGFTPRGKGFTADPINLAGDDGGEYAFIISGSLHIMNHRGPVSLKWPGLYTTLNLMLSFSGVKKISINGGMN